MNFDTAFIAAMFGYGVVNIVGLAIVLVTNKLRKRHAAAMDVWEPRGAFSTQTQLENVTLLDGLPEPTTA